MTDGLTLTRTPSLSANEGRAVAELVAAGAEADGFSGLNEAAVLQLRHRHSGVLHVLARDGDALVGYAQLDTNDPAEAAQDGGTGTAPSTTTGQLVVAPTRRRSGIGAALLSDLVGAAPAPLRLWAMGNTSAARALAAGQGLVAARELLIMTRSLTDPVPPAPLPEGTGVRTFVVGQDEDEWLGVNARAFAHHPEQGQMTRGDLEDRIAESWFDPAGFFLATRDDREPVGPGRIVGFHWTKQHPDRLGEVYVLGVDPSAGGGGLGRSLLARGLSYLRDRGNTAVQLYVEADSRAVSLYTGSGFAVVSRDVMYAQP